MIASILAWLFLTNPFFLRFSLCFLLLSSFYPFSFVLCPLPPSLFYFPFINVSCRLCFSSQVHSLSLPFLLFPHGFSVLSLSWFYFFSPAVRFLLFVSLPSLSSCFHPLLVFLPPFSSFPSFPRGYKGRKQKHTRMSHG